MNGKKTRPGTTHKTGCVLCSQNCGLEVTVENNTMVKVTPDKDNPRSRGYACRKGIKAAFHQHHADRLAHPLKRVGDDFVRISWDQAVTEISEKLKNILDRHGSRALAYMGGGGQGCHFDAFFGIHLSRSLGSRYHYNPLAQELTGLYWVNGRMLGRQNRVPVPDEKNADMVVAWGWNGMASHQMPRAPIVLKEFANNPAKLLVAVDPRQSETARVADIHIPVRPGTDALLARTMIAIIIEKGWENKEYIRQHVNGWDDVRPLFRGFDIDRALSVCGLERASVEDFCRLLTTRKWCLHSDLGVLMNRHSTMTSYLLSVLTAVCGRYCVPGGVVISGILSPLGIHTDDRDPRTWRTIETDFPAIAGFHPPGALCEEILSDHPDRIRALILSSSNPLRSYPDTTAFEKAFERLELTVCIELSMTETARLSDYVLPARSGYESYDGTFFPYTYPEVYFQLRRPIVEPEGEGLECGEIFTRLADGLGLIPPIPQSMYEAAQKDRLAFSMEMMVCVQRNPAILSRLLFVMAKTIGREMGSAHLCQMWGLLQLMMIAYKSPDGQVLPPEEVFLRITDGQGMVPDPPGFLNKGIFRPLLKHWVAFYALLRLRPNTFLFDVNRGGFSIARATLKAFAPGRVWKVVTTALRRFSYMPFMVLSPMAILTEELFEALMDNPQGIITGKSDTDNFREITLPDRRIELFVPELAAAVKQLTPEAEEKALAPDPRFPLILMAGRHAKMNANTLMRNPEWNRGLRGCTLLMHPDDADGLQFEDGQMVTVITDGGRESVELEISETTRPGQVIMPHGFGLCYDGKNYGANVNRLTKNTHRDPIAGTPLHRYVQCRVEAA